MIMDTYIPGSTHLEEANSAFMLEHRISLWGIYLKSYDTHKVITIQIISGSVGKSIQFMEIYYPPGKILLTMDLYNGRCRMWKGTRCIIDIDDYKEFLAIAKEMASELIKIGE